MKRTISNGKGSTRRNERKLAAHQVVSTVQRSVRRKNHINLDDLFQRGRARRESISLQIDSIILATKLETRIVLSNVIDLNLRNLDDPFESRNEIQDSAELVVVSHPSREVDEVFVQSLPDQDETNESQLPEVEVGR
jgi:hypothetical protein